MNSHSKAVDAVQYPAAPSLRVANGYMRADGAHILLWRGP